MLNQPNANPAPRPEPPRWSMLTRRQEQLLLEVWHLQQENGWCFAGQPHLGRRIGCTDRHVRRMVKELAPRWLRMKYRHGQTTLLRAVLPSAGSGGVNSGQSCPGSPRTFMSHPPGHSCPTKRNTKYNTERVPGHLRPDAPPDAPPPAPPAPLFDPPAQVNLWEAHQRLGQRSVCHTVAELFRRGEVQQVRLDGKLRALASANVDPAHFTPRIRIVLPKGSGSEVRDWFDEHLLKLEFYP